MAKNEMAKGKPSLKALIIADCFDRRFLPLLGGSTSWGCLRLANVEILHYTLEWLSRTGVQIDIILATVAEREESLKPILEFWSDCFSSLELVSCQNCMSVGDLIREVEGRSLITSEFLLITNPASFCSFDLRPHLNTFFERRKDKNNVMTLLYTKREGNNPVVCLEKKTNKLVLYHRGEDPTRFSIGKTAFVAESVVRCDIQDTGIALCSPVICSQFSDNFDFQHRDDIIREILVNEEILCQNIHIDVVPSDVAAFTVYDYEGLLHANLLILQRWLYPLMPGRVGDAKFMALRNNIYMALSEEEIKHYSFTSPSYLLHDVGPNVVFGTHCIIDPTAKVKCSSVGHNCVIGAGAVILSSIIGNNVKVGANVQVSQAFVGDNVTLGDEAVIGPQSIIAEKVVIEPRSNVSKKVICASECDEEEEGIICVPLQSGFEWKFANGIQFWCMSSRKRFRGESFVAERDVEKERNTEEEPVPKELNSVEKFLEEVKESMERIAAEGQINNQLIKNLILEINSSKLAYNISMEDVARNVFRSFLELPENENFSKLKMMAKEWILLFNNYYKPIKSQIQALIAIEEHLASTEKFKSLTPNIVHLFYELDVFEEEAILLWHDTLEDAAPIKKLVAPIIDWLNTAEEDDDSE